MGEKEIIVRLKELLISEFDLEDINPDDLKENTPLFGEEIGLDSIDAVELVVILEKHFKVSIKDVEHAKVAFASLSTLAKFITENTGK